MKRNIERILWGVLFIGIGSLMLARVMNLVEFNVFKFAIKLWPAFLIIPAIASLIKGRFLWGLALLLAGVSFLLGNFTDIDVWQYVIPLIIIGFGFSLFFKPKRWNHFVDKDETDDDTVSEVAIFGGVEKKVQSNNFLGGKVDAVFGASEIDLRNASLGNDKVYLEVNAIFGGSEIFVNPENYKVVSKGTGLFGAWTNKSNPSKKDKPTLIISGGAIFGGVEIKD